MTNFEMCFGKIQELIPYSDSLCVAMECARMMFKGEDIPEQEYYMCPHSEEEHCICSACESRLLDWMYEDRNMPDFDNLTEGAVFSCKSRFKASRETFAFVHKYGDTLWVIKDDHGDLWSVDKFADTFVDYTVER